MTTVGEEKKLNKRLTKDLKSFTELMNNLKLPYPKKIGECLKAASPAVALTIYQCPLVGGN